MSIVVLRERLLAPFTSLGLGGPAEVFVEAETRADVLETLAYADAHGLPLHVLGGGSNLVIDDAGVSGLVLRMATRGIRAQHDGDHVLLTAEAGEPFENVVAYAVAHGLAGLECLTGIPGSVGATPIQNVGAYGQEVGDVVDAVEVLERATSLTHWLSHEACGFGYRTSRFKRAPSAHVVLAVRFRLRRGGPASVRYAELARALSGVDAPRLDEVARCVRSLRARKSMLLDPTDPNGRSVGSFFTNPVVSRAEAERVRALARATGGAEEAEMPCYEAAYGQRKLSAAWLIERSGITRGLRRGAVGVSTRHTLCLVHHGGGSTRELLALAQHVASTVESRFGVHLEREPVSWTRSGAPCAVGPDRP